MVGLEGFNDDATETKGISLFSINILAALPANNTDDEVENIRALVAHEYFHNWSGECSWRSHSLLALCALALLVQEDGCLQRWGATQDTHRQCAIVI